MEKLISLDLSYSLIISVTMVLPKLKFLNLSHCRELNRVPNFCESPHVERLILRGCINIFEVGESIECLKGLLILNLEDCTSLKKLPKSLTTLESLEEINLFGCLNLEEMSEDLRKMKSLKVFNASGITINTTTNKETSIVSLPSTTLLHPTVQSWLTSCKRLLSSTLWHPTDQSWPTPCIRLCSTNFSLASLPSSLVELTLENCNLSDDDFPSDLSYLGSLKRLNLGGNLFHSLPESISSLHQLDDLILLQCKALQSISKLPVNLQELQASYCSSLERIENPISSLRFPLLEECDKLVEIKSFFKIYPIDQIDKGILRSLGLPNLESMTNIKVELYNSVSHTRTRTSLQVVHDVRLKSDKYEFSIDNIFIPGDDIPNCFNLQPVLENEEIIYDIHGVAGHKICGFNMCILYTNEFSHYKECRFNSISFFISNITKGTCWGYEPTCCAIPRDGENIKWLIHWKCGDQLEVGDQVHFTVYVNNSFHIKSIGISLDYEADPNYVHQEAIGKLSSYSRRDGDSLFEHKYLPQIRFRVSHYFDHSKYEADESHDEENGKFYGPSE
ncbi:hypothetical protein ACFE04_012725 [Oxalis oulophora]